MEYLFMEELNTPIFAQAKVEYTKQLIEILYPHMFDGVKSIYDESKIIYSSKTGTPILLLLEWINHLSFSIEYGWDGHWLKHCCQ